jgi:membrane-bound lytic murein transglycosylase A
MEPSKNRCRTLFFFLSVLLLAAGCTFTPPPMPSPPATAMVKLKESVYPEFQDEMQFDNLEFALSNSIAYLKRFPEEDILDFGGTAVSYGHLYRSLETFLAFIQTRPDATTLHRFIAQRYQVYRSAGDPATGRVLFTGYYEPSLRGSLQQTERFRYPVYGTPGDLISADLSLFSERFQGERLLGRLQGNRLVPYYERHEIDQNGALLGKAEIIAWVDDPIELFFLQIQGSGRIFLETGSSMYLLYDGKNGRPYRSIGKLLIDQGKISREEMSMQKIRSYLQEHPEEMRDIFNHNPSYVFFRMSTKGPQGCFGFPVTPGRSLALDRRIFPAAAMAYIETELPVVNAAGAIERWIPCRRFVLNQDTGGAIRGPGRADLFWGGGDYAAIAAGHFKAPGDLYFLVLKEEP